MLKPILALSSLLGSTAIFLALPAMAQGASDQPTPPPPPADGGHFQRPTFAELDANHDGSISEDEFNAARPPHGPEGRMGGWRHHGMKDRDGKGHDGREPSMGHRPMDMKTMDTDGDGKISFAEFSARMKAHFDKLDVNHDGVLEASELPQPPTGSPQK